MFHRVSLREQKKLRRNYNCGAVFVSKKSTDPREDRDCLRLAAFFISALALPVTEVCRIRRAIAVGKSGSYDFWRRLTSKETYGKIHTEPVL